MVCRELGLTNATKVYRSSVNKGGTIWMNNLQCTGNERSVVLCVHDGWKNHSCTNDQQAGVMCSVPEGKSIAF